MTQSALIAGHRVHGVFERRGAVSPMKTFCGILCWPSSSSNEEADTADDKRIEVTQVLAKVTCRRCLKTDWFKP